jgi:hypothetical protein
VPLRLLAQLRLLLGGTVDSSNPNSLQAEMQQLSGTSRTPASSAQQQLSALSGSMSAATDGLADEAVSSQASILPPLYVQPKAGNRCGWQEG